MGPPPPPPPRFPVVVVADTPNTVVDDRASSDGFGELDPETPYGSCRSNRTAEGLAAVDVPGRLEHSRSASGRHPQAANPKAPVEQSSSRHNDTSGGISVVTPNQSVDNFSIDGEPYSNVRTSGRPFADGTSAGRTSSDQTFVRNRFETPAQSSHERPPQRSVPQFDAWKGEAAQPWGVSPFPKPAPGNTSQYSQEQLNSRGPIYGWEDPGPGWTGLHCADPSVPAGQQIMWVRGSSPENEPPGRVKLSHAESPRVRRPDQDPIRVRGQSMPVGRKLFCHDDPLKYDPELQHVLKSGKFPDDVSVNSAASQGSNISIVRRSVRSEDGSRKRVAYTPIDPDAGSEKSEKSHSSYGSTRDSSDMNPFRRMPKAIQHLSGEETWELMGALREAKGGGKGNGFGGPQVRVATNPDKFDGDEAKFLEWRQNIHDWRDATSVPPEKQGPLMRYFFSGTARMALNHISTERLSSPDGFELIIRTLDEMFYKSTMEVLFARFNALMFKSRPSSMGWNQFFLNFEDRRIKFEEQLTGTGIVFPEFLYALLMIRQSMLTAQESTALFSRLPENLRELSCKAVKDLSRQLFLRPQLADRSHSNSVLVSSGTGSQRLRGGWS